MNDPASGAPGRGSWLVLAGLAAAGLVLRLINLDSCLSYDEIVTLVKYVRLPAGTLVRTCTEFNNHMLFSLAAQASIAGLGESAWALRLPAVLFGVATIPAFWWLASQVLGRREALGAALLLAVSSHHVGFSQSARGYTGLLFFGYLATALFLKGLRRPGRGVWIAYAAVTAAALYTHLTAAFTLAAHGLVWAFLFARARFGREPARVTAHPGAATLKPLAGMLGGGVFAAALYAPLIPAFLWSFREHVGMESSFTKVRAWTSPLWTLNEIVHGLGLSTAAVAALAIVAVLAAIGGFSLLRRDPAAVFAMVLFAPLALAVFWGFKYHIWPRYFLPLLGPALIFLVRGIGVVASLVAPRAAGVVIAAAIILLAVGSVMSLAPSWKLPREDYCGAKDYVIASSKPGEPVLTSGMAGLAYSWLYAPEWTVVEKPADLNAKTAGVPRAWFVYAFPTALRDSNPGVLERVQERFKVVGEFPGTVHDGTVVVCRTR